MKLFVQWLVLWLLFVLVSDSSLVRSEEVAGAVTVTVSGRDDERAGNTCAEDDGVGEDDTVL